MTTIEEAERAVIGATLLDPNSIRFTTQDVIPADFSDVRLGQVYGLLIGLHASGLPVDEITAMNAAREQGMPWVTALGLHDLKAGTPTAANAGYYARIVAEGAVERRMVMAGLRFQQLAGASMPLAEKLTAARGEWDAVRTSVNTGLATQTLADMLDGPDTYDWLIPDLIERMDRLILTGGEGAGKSTLMRQIAILAAAGIHPVTFARIEPVKVLVLDAENSQRQWRRKARPLVHKARLEGATDPGQAIQIACVDDMPNGRLDLTTERDLGIVHRLLDEHEPDMLLIGPLYKLTPGAINSDDDAAPLLKSLDGLRARGVALLMEAHAGHQKTGRGDRDMRPRGSAALMGWPEFGLGLAMDPDDQSGSTAKLIPWRGHRDERAWPTSLARGGAWPWTDLDRKQWTPRYPGDPT